jgi:uncharacterized protein (DUF433 family)
MSTPTTSTEGRTAPVIGEYIAVTPGRCGGKPHLIGHRIKVEHVAYWHERLGLSPREIVEAHPPLTLAAVYAALAYYHDHRAEIDADIESGRDNARQLESQQPSLLEKLAEKRPDVTGLSAAAALAYVRSGRCPPGDVERLRADLPRRFATSPAEPDLAELRDELACRPEV